MWGSMKCYGICSCMIIWISRGGQRSIYTFSEYLTTSFSYSLLTSMAMILNLAIFRFQAILGLDYLPVLGNRYFYWYLSRNLRQLGCRCHLWLALVNLYCCWHDSCYRLSLMFAICTKHSFNILPLSLTDGENKFPKSITNEACHC